MFTGIVEEMGIIKDLSKKANLYILKVQGKKILPNIQNGESIAIDGVCLTVTGKSGNILSFDMMKETLDKTALGEKEIGDKVNLERALLPTSRLGGHFVTGHIDEMGTVLDVVNRPNYTEIVISLPTGLAKYIAPKGSICLNGVSLTVGKVNRDNFSVYLIPFTVKTTTFGLLKKTERVNIEIDILARYILNQKGRVNGT